MTEAFVYKWTDSINNKFYVGFHKGTPDDGYTHSSYVWPRFSMNNIPEGVSREIIATGSWEEMAQLESDILDNCICNGFKKFNMINNETYDVKQFGTKKGASGTPFGISKDGKILFVTKEIKLKSKSLTKKK